MLTRNDSLKSTKNCFLNANKVEYIVVHYTACLAPAKNFCLNQMNNDLSNGGSAHDFVSENEWYQSIDPAHGAWSVGDDQGYGRYPFGITNYNSLNIEMIAEGYKLASEKTRQNTAEIVAYYMKVYNVPLSKVVRHYDATRKPCPYGMHGITNDYWNDFKYRVQVALNNGNKEEKKVDGIVVYQNELDGYIASWLGYNLNYPVIHTNCKFDYSVCKNVICVGGAKTSYTGYCTKHISGSDRYETVKEVLKFLGKL